MYKSVFYFLLLLNIGLIDSKANTSEVKEVIELFDTRAYNPITYGLKDLVFVVRVPAIEKSLNDQKVYGKIADLHFRLYWLYPGEKRIEVLGLPKGFKELKRNLKNMVKDKFEYFIPGKLTKKLRAYNLKVNKKGKRTIEIHAVDPTQKQFVGQMYITLQKDGLLKRLKSLSPVGSSDSNFDFSVMPWSHNKWVLTKMKLTNISGMQTVKTQTNIEYQSIGGFGIPSKIDIKTEQEVLVPNTKNKKNIVKNNIIYNISQVFTNSGRALKYIKK